MWVLSVTTTQYRDQVPNKNVTALYKELILSSSVVVKIRKYSQEKKMLINGDHISRRPSRKFTIGTRHNTTLSHNSCFPTGRYHCTRYPTSYLLYSVRYPTCTFCMDHVHLSITGSVDQTQNRKGNAPTIITVTMDLVPPGISPKWGHNHHLLLDHQEGWTEDGPKIK